jgi:hypothetical protein
MNYRTVSAAFLSLCLGLLSSCEKEVPEQVADVKVVKQNAIELIASTARLPDGRFVVHLHKNLYHNSQLIGVDTLRDTLPDLGMEQVKVENDDGEATTQRVPVQYNILFKVDSLKLSPMTPASTNAQRLSDTSRTQDTSGEKK